MNAAIGVPMMYEMFIKTNCVPNVYISAVTPNNVMADIKLAINENATGMTLMELSAKRYSDVVLCFPPVNL